MITRDTRARSALLVFSAVLIVLLFNPIRHNLPLSLKSASLHNKPAANGAPTNPPKPDVSPTAGNPSWLIWTSSAVKLRQRREIIRSTWQTLYKDVPFTARFVVGNPGPEWMPVLQQENNTYGDMIMLDHPLGDDRHFATTEKPLEFWKYLVNAADDSGRKYDFVSKVDDDSFVDARTFYKDFLVPRKGAEKTLIARRCKSGIYWPAGMFYTMTWDMLSVAINSYTAHPFKLEHEDWPLGKMLHDSGEEFDFVQLTEEKAFDVVREGMVTEKTILPHKMKTDEEYLWVAAMYDSKGFRGTKLKGKDGTVDLVEKVKEHATEDQQPNGWKCENG